MSSSGKKHRFHRITVAGAVVLRCRCGWRAWPPPHQKWYDPVPPIPPERRQWEMYQAHVRPRTPT